MKSLLAISWWFPPLLGPRSIQVAKSLNSLARRGWDITVVTTGTRNLPFGISQDQLLVQTYCQELHTVRIAMSRFTLLREIVAKLRPEMRLMPDPQILWAQKAQQEVPALIDNIAFDAMISFGQPFSVHLLAEEIAQQNHLPWLAHFSDPWSDNPYLRGLSSQQKESVQQMERGVVLAADKLVFTNQPTVDLVMAKYSPVNKQKASIIPHGFDLFKLQELPLTQFKKNPAKLTLLHLGNIYGIRSPLAIFEALELLKDEKHIFDDLDMAFVGAVSKKGHWLKLIRQKGIAVGVRFEDRVGYLQSLSIGRQADVLITLDAPSDNESVFLPSKLVEYLSLNTVILGITPAKGVSADLLRSLHMPIAHPQDARQIADAIRDLHTQWKQGKLAFDWQRSQIAKSYEIEATTDKLESALLNMVEAG